MPSSPLVWRLFACSIPSAFLFYFPGCTPEPNSSEPVISGECTKYVREDFGYPADLDDDCQNTRAEVLISHSLVPVKFTSPSNCTVASGKWLDPYSGDTILNATDLQIDHLVPLSEANKSGSYAWTMARKVSFGNDALNLIPTKSDINTLKSDSDPGEWLPPNKGFHKAYCSRFVSVKEKYGLTVDQREFDTLTRYTESVSLKVGVECFGN